MDGRVTTVVHEIVFPRPAQCVRVQLSLLTEILEPIDRHADQVARVARQERRARGAMQRVDHELRVEADVTADKLGAKIRRAQMEKIPYMLVVGEKDMAARVVSPRSRDGGQQPAAPLEEFAARLRAEAKPPKPGSKS